MSGHNPLLESLFPPLRNVRMSQWPRLVQWPLADRMPRQSSRVSVKAFRDVCSLEEPRLLTITAHLYLDYAMAKVLAYHEVVLSKRQRESFSAKLVTLRELRTVDRTTLGALVALNRLRNAFAHDVFYDIVLWDPATVPYVVKHQLAVPRRRALRRAFAIMIIRLSFMVLLERLGDCVEDGTFGYMPRVPRSRRSILLPEAFE